MTHLQPLTLEIGLAQTLGVSRATLKAVRSTLTLDVHWRQQGRNVAYTDAGVAEIRRIMALPTDIAVDPIAPPTGLEEELEVVRSNFKNRRIIQARRKNGELVLVRVRAADNFRTRLTSGHPMTLRASNDGGAIWWHKGRCPRAPGKW